MANHEIRYSLYSKETRHKAVNVCQMYTNKPVYVDVKGCIMVKRTLRRATNEDANWYIKFGNKRKRITGIYDYILPNGRRTRIFTT